MLLRTTGAVHVHVQSAFSCFLLMIITHLLFKCYVVVWIMWGVCLCMHVCLDCPIFKLIMHVYLREAGINEVLEDIKYAAISLIYNLL